MSRRQYFEKNFFVFVNKGNYFAVLDAINEGVSVNRVNMCGNTALMMAVKNGYVKITNLLIDNGANINSRNPEGDTPLHFAVNSKIFKLVEILIENDANINAKNKKGRTPLHLAVERFDIEIIKFLCKNGANVDAIDNKGSTPLLRGIRKKAFNGTQLCLIHECNANINIKDNKGRNAFYLNVVFNNGEKCIDILNYLFSNTENIDINMESNDGFGKENALIGLIKHCNKDDPLLLIKTIYLINKGINVNYQENKFQDSALHLSILFDDLNVFKYLLTVQGIDINIQRITGQTPLHYAAEKETSDYLNLLLPRVSNVNIQDEYDATPLFYCENEQNLIQLINRRANIHLVTKNGETSLIIACKLNSYTCAEYIIKNGIDVHAKTIDNYTALYYSIGNNNKRLFDLLMQNGANFNDLKDIKKNDECLLLSIMCNKPDLLENLLMNGANPDKRIGNDDGDPILFRAIMKNSLEMVQILIKYKADVNIVNKNKMTPLMVAVKIGNTEITLLLVKNGADVNAKLENGHDALVILLGLDDFEQKTEIAKCLIPQEVRSFIFLNNLVDKTNKIKNSVNKFKFMIENGASVDSKDEKTGETILMRAVIYSNKEIVEYLIKKGANVNIESKRRKTALQLAKSNRYESSLSEEIYELVKNAYYMSNPKKPSEKKTIFSLFK